MRSKNITSACEVMFCGCLFLCLQNNSENVENGKKKICVDYGDSPDHLLDPGFLITFIIALSKNWRCWIFYALFGRALFTTVTCSIR